MTIIRSKTFGSTTPRPWLWARLSTVPANRFEISGLAPVREIIAKQIIDSRQKWRARSRPPL